MNKNVIIRLEVSTGLDPDVLHEALCKLIHEGDFHPHAPLWKQIADIEVFTSTLDK